MEKFALAGANRTASTRTDEAENVRPRPRELTLRHSITIDSGVKKFNFFLLAANDDDDCDPFLLFSFFLFVIFLYTYI